ncbi:MAG: protein-export chaperone SecB [Alphaproteobacteria bacterium]
MTENKDTTAQTESQDQQPQLVIHTQYIKDFSFENPNSPKVLIENDGQPEIEINVNVTANPQPQDRLFEVVLHIRASAKRKETNMFIAELSYAAIIQVSESVDEKALHPIVMIEGPRLIFPFARTILAQMTQAGGFMPLNIQPIDFVRVYQNGMEAAAGNA